MGGYAFYVWGAYGVTALLMIAEVILVMRRRRSTVTQLARAARAEQSGVERDESAQ
jgi:heme exporter protein D